MLYFVVRTDVDRSEGMQRVFGCYDTAEEANDFIRDHLNHLKATFKVFSGTEVDEG